MSKVSFVSELLKKKGENQIEFLIEFDAGKILKTICSFLNDEGGWILIGHNGKETIGLLASDEMVSELMDDINDKIFPQPLVYVQKDIYEHKDVVLINVLKGSRQPYSFDNKIFIRSKGVSKEASPDEISLLLRSSNIYNSTWEKLTTISAELEDLDLAEVKKTIDDASQIRKGKSLPENIEEFLSYFQLSDYGSIKNGAIVLFGEKPDTFLPQCRIRITIIPDGVTGSHYEDTEIIEDNLFSSFTQVNQYFRRNLPVVSDFRPDNWTRVDREKYPSDALDEAIVNAMVHRDYGDMSGEITINIHKDKIEIINSGEIPDDIVRNKSVIHAHHSILRNPTIAHIFYLRGKMEKLGRGLSLIKERFMELGLQAPEWRVKNGYTSLTLFGIPKAIEINERMRLFLEDIGKETRFSREEYEAHFTDISERTARLDIAKLLEGGWIDKLGDGALTRYFVTGKKLPDVAG